MIKISPKVFLSDGKIKNFTAKFYMYIFNYEFFQTTVHVNEAFTDNIDVPYLLDLWCTIK